MEKKVVPEDRIALYDYHEHKNRCYHMKKIILTVSDQMQGVADKKCMNCAGF